MLKKIYKRPIFWLSLPLIVYALIGFFVVPKLLQKELKKQLVERFGNDIEIAKVHFNPFSFKAELITVSITDKQQQQWFFADNLQLNFEPLALMGKSISFASIQLQNPKLKLHLDAENQLITPQLLMPEASDNDNSSSDWTLTIEDNQITNAQLDLQIDTIADGFAKKISHLNWSQQNFSLTEGSSPFKLKFDTAEQETITLTGSYNHQQGLINSDFSVQNANPIAWQALLPSDLTVASGLISSQGQLTWKLSQQPQFKFAEIATAQLNAVWQQQAELQNLTATAKNVELNIDQQQFTITDLSRQAGEIKWLVTAEQPTAATQIEQPPATEQQAQAAAQIDTATEPKNWLFELANIQFENFPVSIHDAITESDIQVNLSNLSVQNLSNTEQPIIINAELQPASQGLIKIAAQVSLLPELQVQAKLTATDLALTDYNPWIEKNSLLTVGEGSLSTEQEITVNQQQWQTQGMLKVAKLSLLNQQQQPLAKLQGLLIEKLQADSESQVLNIEQLVLDQAQGELLVDQNKQLNINNLNNKNNKKTTKKQTSKDSQWQVKIGKIKVKDSTAKLIDQSLKPQVISEFSQLNGEISGLSSKKLSEAKVKMKGKFNKFSPVSIKGSLNSDRKQSSLDIAIKDLDLLRYSPYAAQNIDFPITGGQLSLQLSYQLQGKKLSGKNNLQFKQLKLGEKQNNPDAVNLPLKLAMSLLTNGKGEMDIDLPVSGHIDDPQFSFGGLIGKAFFNLITGIVASPFKILGALIPNPAPDLNHIYFTAGSVEIIEGEQLKLQQIAEIMQKKPSLNLKLSTQQNRQQDTEFLQQKMLLAQAQVEQFDAENEALLKWLKKNAEPIDPDSFDPKKIWLQLQQQQPISEQQLKQLSAQRFDAVKKYLIEQQKLSADKIFQQPPQPNGENNQVIISVGR